MAGGASAGVQRGKHLCSTLFSAGALLSLLALGGGAFAAGAFGAGSVAIGAAAAAAVALCWFLIVLALGLNRAQEEFYGVYAGERGLEWSQDGRLAAATSLLRRGDSRRAAHGFTGTLPGGLNGQIALFTYVEHATGPASGGAEEYHHFTVVIAEVPSVRERLPALAVQRRAGFRFLDGAEDAFAGATRVELESEQLDKRCEIFAAGADANWLRQLFSPSFVDFLAAKTPEGFAFEVENGVLCVNVNRHRGTAAELDELAQATATVAKRLNEEAAE